RQREKPVRPHRLARPEPLDPPQKRRRPNPVPRAGVHHRDIEGSIAAPVALAEVEPQLQRPTPRLAHSSRPIQCPKATAASPATSDSAMFAHSTRASPPSPARCDSSIQVENVV